MRYFYLTSYGPDDTRYVRTVEATTRVDVFKWLRLNKHALICLLEITKEEHEEYNKYHESLNINENGNIKSSMEEAVNEKRM